MEDDLMTDDPNTDETIEAPTIGTPTDDPKDLLRQARELIPVGRGAAPINWSNVVDFARDMAKAKYTIPDHFKGNVGDCLAICNLAARTGLDPYMIANKTYIEKGHLEFQSQLYHAFAQASGQLRGDLSVEYSGEGDEMVCVVSGYLKNDPRPRVHSSEPLKKAHPGFSEKDGKRFVRGSQLWEKKPKVQLAYDTMRDWVRLYAPRATLGMPEFAEAGPDVARDVTPGSGLAARLAAAPRTETGHKEGHAEAELQAVRAANGLPGEAQEATADAVEAAASAAEADPPAKQPKRATSHAKPKTGVRGGYQAPDGGMKPKAPTTGSGVVPARTVKVPTTVAEYLVDAERWIRAEKDKVEIGQRWARERTLRNKLGVTADDRAKVEAQMQKKLKE